jgi:A/G-specific adenine glycosylase
MEKNSQQSFEEWQNIIQSSKFHAVKQQFQQNLLSWFEKHGRDLPWRKTHDPFEILVSELMLQQTQVERVMEYWPRFLARFPNFKSVAESTEEEVIVLWEGLGYYNRARNLHKLAKVIQDQYGGIFPTDRDEILKLPGIGEYTAGAIMSFALLIRAPIVDTNVIRVYSRVFLKNQTQKEESNNTLQKIFWLLADSLTPMENFWEYNQGIMDFGAIQCMVDKPKCNICPMRTFCRYYQRSSLQKFIK